MIRVTVLYNGARILTHVDAGDDPEIDSIEWGDFYPKIAAMMRARFGASTTVEAIEDFRFYTPEGGAR